MIPTVSNHSSLFKFKKLKMSDNVSEFWKIVPLFLFDFFVSEKFKNKSQDYLGSADRWGWYKDKNPQIQE